MVGMGLLRYTSSIANGDYVGLLSTSSDDVMVGMGLLSYKSSIANGVD